MRSKKFSNKSDTCFMIKSVSSCSFFRYNYTTHDFVLKLDDVRVKKRCFGFWTRCSSYYARYPTHTIKIFCQKENRFFVVAFTACDVFRILEILSPLEIFLSSFNFGICFRFYRTVPMVLIPSSKGLLINVGLLKIC